MLTDAILTSHFKSKTAVSRVGSQAPQGPSQVTEGSSKLKSHFIMLRKHFGE